MSLLANQAFERRVLDAYRYAADLPLSAPIWAYPAELQHHGSVVLREAAARRIMARKRQGCYCRRCAAWYPIIQGEVSMCPNCRAVLNEAAGGDYICVVRPANKAGRGHPIVHAVATDRWIRSGAEPFVREPGEFLCRTDRFQDRHGYVKTEEQVTCGRCLANLRAHFCLKADAA